MVKYKVNLKFKDTGKSLNEIITNVLKIELEKQINIACNNLNKNILKKHTHYFRNERSMNKDL